MAYGARLESVLGASPRGFESLILRVSDRGKAEVPTPGEQRCPGMWSQFRSQFCLPRASGGRRPGPTPAQYVAQSPEHAPVPRPSGQEAAIRIGLRPKASIPA